MIKFLIVFLIPASAMAGAFGTLVCKACNFKEPVMMGGTMQDAKNGFTRNAFFCAKTKKLVHRVIAFDGKTAKVPKETIARDTKKPVEKSAFHYFTDSECPDQLIPVEYYVKNPTVPCPICGKGPVEIENEGFAD